MSKDRPVIYVSGPMRGIAEFNFPAFFAAEKYLTDLGYDVVNPARLDREAGFDPSGLTGREDLEKLGFSLRAALGAELGRICSECDFVCLLPGWELSSGARAEVAVAEALGLKVQLYHLVPQASRAWHPSSLWLSRADTAVDKVRIPLFVKQDEVPVGAFFTPESGLFSHPDGRWGYVLQEPKRKQHPKPERPKGTIRGKHYTLDTGQEKLSKPAVDALKAAVDAALDPKMSKSAEATLRRTMEEQAEDVIPADQISPAVVEVIKNMAKRYGGNQIVTGRTYGPESVTFSGSKFERKGHSAEAVDTNPKGMELNVRQEFYEIAEAITEAGVAMKKLLADLNRKLYEIDKRMNRRSHD